MPLKDGATNDFLPFASEVATPNVLPQEEYAALPARAGGFQSGVARSVELNKAWRQPANFAAGSGQFLANRNDSGVRDDGDLDALEAAWVAGIRHEADDVLLPVKQHGILPWSEAIDYPVNGICMGADGILYQALQASGPGDPAVGPKNPTVEGSGGYWTKAVADEVPIATTTTRGISRQSTAAEATNGVTGENGPAFISPEQLKAGVDAKVNLSEYSQIPFKRVWVSGQYTPSRGTPIIATHNLNIANPLRALGVVNLVCLVAEGGYAVGDIASASARFTAGSGSGLTGTAVATLTANTIEVTPGASANNGFTLSRKDTGAYLDCTAGRWAVVFRVYY